MCIIFMQFNSQGRFQGNFMKLLNFSDIVVNKSQSRPVEQLYLYCVFEHFNLE